MEEDVPAVLLVLSHRGQRRRVAADWHGEPGAGLEQVDEAESEEQRNGRRGLEIQDRLQPDPPHRLQVAGAGNANDERCEEQRRDDHLDHPQKCVRQRLDGDADVGPVIADSNAGEQPDEDLGRQTRRATGAPGRRAAVSVQVGLSHSMTGYSTAST